METILEKIITVLSTPTHRYKGIPVNCFGMPTFSSFKKQSIRNAFAKLEKRGYLTKKEKHWYLKPGKPFAGSEKRRHFESPFEEDAPKNMILMFDIPEKKRTDRSWLRRQLRMFGYVLLQKSVWIGPSPLPREFVDYMKKAELWNTVRTFKLTKAFVQK